MIQPFQRRKITKTILDTGRAAETVDEGENALHCFLSVTKAANRMHQFLLENRVETLTPSVVTGHFGSRKTLLCAVTTGRYLK